MPLIIEENEKEMVVNLIARFHEWQQKHPNKAIEVELSSNKQRTDEKGSFSKLAANTSFISISPSPPAPKAQDMESIPFHGLGEIVNISGDDSMPSVHTPLVAPVNVLSQEELDVLLKHFPTFTNMEPPVSYMKELFPIMKWVLVDVTADLQQNFMAHVPHGTSGKTMEVIMQLKDYSAMQMAKVV